MLPALKPTTLEWKREDREENLCARRIFARKGSDFREGKGGCTFRLDESFIVNEPRGLLSFSLSTHFGRVYNCTPEAGSVQIARVISSRVEGRAEVVEV